MRYRNTKTGQIIDVPSKLRGGNWEEIGGDKSPKKETVTVDVPVLNAEEEVSSAKPKRTRRTSKK